MARAFPIFEDRRDAGRRLAQRLSSYAGKPDLLVLGLPRGGVEVAFEVAQALKAPLDAFVVRKLGVPGYEELAMGAIASGGTLVMDWDRIRSLRLSEEDIERVIQKERRELRRRERVYRGSHKSPKVRGRKVILVDDGLATGTTMTAAVLAVRGQEPSRIAVAVPVASDSAYAFFKRQVDDMICVAIPEPFHGVGEWYDDFSQTTDEEVKELLSAGSKSESPFARRPNPYGR